MTTKEELLDRLDRVEEKVDAQLSVLKAGSDALEKRALEQADVIKDLEKGNKKLSDQVVDLTAEKAQLERKLEGFQALGRALGQVRGEGLDVEQVRRVVQEELAKSPGAATTAEGVRVSEAVPFLSLEVSRPWLTLDESTLAGMVTVLALKDKLPGKFGFADVVKSLEQEYSWKVGGGSQRRRLQEALDELVGKYKALERAHDSSANQVLYQLREDARDRVKEKQIREVKAVQE